LRTEFEIKIKELTLKFLNEKNQADDQFRNARLENNELLIKLDAATKENNNLILQMKGLGEKIEDDQKRIAILGQEISRLSDNMLEKAREVENWKNKYTALERKAQLQTEELKSQLELAHRNEIVS
jgi:hypothetical protein